MASTNAQLPSRAVILAGGLGMRMRPYTMVLPKPLIPIGDYPILEHIIRRLASAGITHVDICLGRHLGGLIQTYLSQATTLPDGLALRFHWEEKPRGTAGALRGIDDLEGSFMVINGDVLTTLDYRLLMSAHRDNDALLTIATRRQRVDISLGVIEWEAGLVTGYREKPSLFYDASMGIYMFDQAALDYVPAEGPWQFPDLVIRLLEAGEAVAPFMSDADWYDIGTPAEYERAMHAVRARPHLFEP